ncbi:hypothetical protein Tco_0882312 [Tanacetum coccineum]
MIHPQSSQAPAISLQSSADPIQFDSGLVVPYFLPTDDPLECLNKCTQPTKVQNSAWFKEKMLLAQVQKAGIALYNTPCF